MYTGWVLSFLFGVVTGVLGARAQLPLWSYLPMAGGISIMISQTAISWGMP